MKMIKLERELVEREVKTREQEQLIQRLNQEKLFIGQQLQQKLMEVCVHYRVHFIYNRRTRFCFHSLRITSTIVLRNYNKIKLIV